MKQKSTYQQTLRTLAFLTFIAFFVSNTVAPFWLLDSETFTHSLIDLKDTESEKEEEKQEEEIDKRIRLSLSKNKFLRSGPVINPQHWKFLQSLHHPDILTPPPEQV